MSKIYKQRIGILISIIVAITFALCPSLGGMTSYGITTIGLMISFLILLITEALPIVLICFLFLGLMPVLHVTDNFASALVGFSNPVVFFILASFAIAAAFVEVPLSERVLKMLLVHFGRDINTILFSLMAGSAIISSVVSNVPTCAIFMAIADSLLDVYTDETSKRSSGRAFMIGIPVASMIGGMITPAGSSINLLALGLLEQFAGISVSFIQWMAIGMPLAIVMLPLAWFLIIRIYKPQPISPATVKAFIQGLDVPDKMDAKEKKVITIVILMLLLWILSSWVPSINVMVVALLGSCIFFLPGVDILEMDGFLRNTSWDSFYLVATVLSLGNSMVTNGVSEWIINIMPSLKLNMALLVICVAFMIFALLVIIPVAPSLVTIMASPLIALAALSGTSPVVTVMTLALCACNCYLLPLDTVTLLTYSKGYYSMTDMVKCTGLLQISLAILMGLWIPLSIGFMGIM